MTRAGVRSVVGASMLSTALLIGGPMAVAMAEGDSGSSSSSPSSDSDTPAQSSPATTRVGDDIGAGIRASLRQSITNLRSAVGPWAGQRPRFGFDTRPPAASTTTPDSAAAADAELALAAPDGALTEPEATAPATEQLPATVPTVPAVTPSPADTPNSSNTPPVKPVGNSSPKPLPVRGPLVYDKLPEVVHTVGNTVASVLSSTQQTVAAVPALLVALPGSTTPVSDVISTIEFMLTSVSASVGTIVALPGELSELMGVGIRPVATIGKAPETLPVTALSAPMALPGLLPEAPVTALGAGVVAPAPAAPVPSPVTPVSAQRMAPLDTASLGVSGLTASGAPESFLDRAVSTLLVPISIATLAAVALPGVGGLLVICALGIRIGYRQAKAGWAIRVAGIARFAGSGPMGVVRSGAMITLHTKRPAAARKVGHLRLVDSSLEQAA